MLNTESNGLSIIIPAHNEESRIGATLEQHIAYFTQHRPDCYEIIVVLNGCEDDTLGIVNSYSQDCKAVKVHQINEKGKGYAIKFGFKMASYGVLCFTDADGATKPAELLRLVDQLDGNNAVIGSRWLSDSIILRHQSIIRRILSRGLNVLVRVFFRLPFTDTQCGAKVFKKKAIENILEDVNSGDFTFDIELLHKMSLNGLSIKESAIVWEAMDNSKVNLIRVIPQMANKLVNLWLNSLLPVKPKIKVIQLR